jgi:tetratricopeptide (TPR) repeat protein
MRKFLLLLFSASVLVATGFCSDAPPSDEPLVVEDEAVLTNESTATEPQSAEAPVEIAEEAAPESVSSEETESDATAAQPESTVVEVEPAAPVVEEAEVDESPAAEAPKAAPANPEPAPVAATPMVTESPKEPALSSAAQSVDAMMKAEIEAATARISMMEQVMFAQYEREAALYRDTIKLIITFGIAFAVIAGLGLLAAAFINYRALMAVQIVMLKGQQTPALTAGPTNALLPGGSEVPGMERVQASGQRFHSQMSSLDHRLSELENIAAGREHATGETMEVASKSQPAFATGSDASLEPPPQRVIPRAAILAHKAQAQMNLGKLNEALETLDEAETLGDARSDVFLTRGKVLEKLGRLDDAIAAFDEAAHSDEANTNALLMKAGVLNRQERYSEALECYEQALAVHRLST